ERLGPPRNGARPICTLGRPDGGRRRGGTPEPHWLMHRARTLALVAILVAFATQGAAPALADGGFFGVHDASSSLSHRDLKRMDKGHVGTVRHLMYWPGLEPRSGQFNWVGYDRIVGGLASKGIAV